MKNNKFGLCKCPKFGFKADIEENKLEYENYDLIYYDYEDYWADFSVNEEFGCINHVIR